MNRFQQNFSTSTVLALSIGPDENNHPPIEIPALGGMGFSAQYGIPDIYRGLSDDEDYIIAKSLGEFGSIKKISIYDETKLDDVEELTKLDKKSFHWVMDSKGIPKVRVACDQDWFCENIDTYYLGEDGKWTLIYEQKQSELDGYITDVFYPFEIDEATGNLWVIARSGNDERKVIKAFDPKSRKFTETIYEHPVNDVEGILFDSETNKSVGVSVFTNRLEFFVTEPTLKEHYDFLKTQFAPDESFRIIENNIKGERAMVYVTSPNSPGKYYIYDPKTKSVAFAMARSISLNKNLNGAAEALKVKMRDGTLVDVYRYFPKGQNKGAPLIVMPHGGPHVRDYFAYDNWVQFFVSRGYQVMQINFRGSSGYGVTHEVAGFGEWGGLMQDDVTDAVKYMQENGYASPDKTCIVGYSYGGYVALYGGGSTPELYKCIVSGGGVVDLVRSMKNDQVRLTDQSFAVMVNSMGDLSDKDFLKERSPSRLADNFVAPVLLLHGERDQTVSKLHSRRMKDALKKADKVVTYVELEEAGHSGWTIENEILYLETVETFLKEHIGP